MTSKLHTLKLTVAVTLALTNAASIAGAATTLPTPPVAPAEPVTDTYFGTSLIDPYRWMEKGDTDSRFIDYLKSENTYGDALLRRLRPRRDVLLARIEGLGSGMPTYVGHWKRAGNAIFLKRLDTATGLVTLRVRDSAGKERVLLDPRSDNIADQHAHIDYFVPSPDGRYVIAGVSLGGSENSTIRIIDTATGRTLPERITRAEGSDAHPAPSWRSDGRAFFYPRLQQRPADAAPSTKYENTREYLHILGTDPNRDSAVFGPGVSRNINIPKAGFVHVTTALGSPFVIAGHDFSGGGDATDLYTARAKDVRGAATPWRHILSPSDGLAETDVQFPSYALHGKTLYLLLTRHPNRTLVSFDLDDPKIASAQTVVAPSDDVLEGVYAASDALYLVSRNGVGISLSRVSYTNHHRQPIRLPFAGSVYEIDANSTLNGLLFGIASWLRSDSLERLDARGRVWDTKIQPANSTDFSGIESREVLVPSTDGAQVPLSIIVRRGASLNGAHPTLLDGYGSYGISKDPTFDATRIAWMERGGVLAYAHPRGGGEYGERWHQAGRKATKQHTIDDMVASARYLIATGYTSPAHLAIKGESAGGIAVGGAITQHPELFAAAIDSVGMTDPIRYANSAGGAANFSEYGDPTRAGDFPALYGISAYYHVVDKTPYPALLGITGINDPRVPPWIVAKMIARVRAATSSGRPVVLFVDFGGGHFASGSEEALANQWTFLLWQLGDPEFQPAK